ncbi:hypothetical protein [Corallococcus exercitus]|uniref:hypothetical protein n=1 Tax=Corallococcus exercitus TaxID=2316736 RepID=UPI0035D4582A
MSEFLKHGDLVEHASMGLGKVIEADEVHLHVYFLEQESRFAAKLKRNLVGSLLRRATSHAHPELDALPLFVRDGGRYRLEQEVMTFDQAVARFRQEFPDSFGDAKYAREERNYKWKAHEALTAAFGDGKGLRLIAEGRVREVVETALHTERKTNLTHPQFEKPRIADALADPDAAAAFFTALFRLVELQRPTQPAFEELVRAMDALPTPGGPLARWPTVSIFPALLRPDAFIFFRPTFTQEAAARLAYELNYKPEPNWLTYKSVLGFADVLLTKLKPLGAKDFVDVQSFIYVTASGAGYNK